MTHDELLDTIGHWNWIKPKPLLNALRAVVELHKPRAYKNEIDEMYIKGWNAAMDKVIKTIERELK